MFLKLLFFQFKIQIQIYLVGLFFELVCFETKKKKKMELEILSQLYELKNTLFNQPKNINNNDPNDNQSQYSLKNNLTSISLKIEEIAKKQEKSFKKTPLNKVK